MSRAVAEVDLKAIKNNLTLIKSKTSAQVLAVVKADGYGHGLIPVSKAAIEAGADWLGTALLEEAIELRKNGIKVPIIAWLTPCGEDFKEAINLDIDLSISSLEVLTEIVTAGEQLKKLPRVHIEIDTGMSRGGIGDDWKVFTLECSRLIKENKLEVVGIWSHFARADEPLEKMSQEQLLVFYGASAIVTHDTKLGVVAIGYADGIPRNANSSAGVWVAGKRAPLIGRVSMDQFVVDLGATSLAKTGDEVIVFGNGNQNEYTVDEWAKACGTINYEIVTRIGPRVPRIYTRE